MSDASIFLDPGSMRRFATNLLMTEVSVIEGAAEGVQLAAELAFDRAQTNVPVLSGALRASGEITANDSVGLIERVISYGNDTPNPMGVPTAAYAAQRHETPNKQKPAAYKWLETAVRDVGEDLLLEAVATSIEQALK